MEISPVKSSSTPSVMKSWTSKSVSALCVLFLSFDAIGKIVKESHTVAASAELGIPVSSLPFIGVLLLACTIIYLIPRTATLGAILLTGYLGGAMATMLIAGKPVYFALGTGLVVWIGLYLRNPKITTFITSGC